jgi:hypothetical protein
MRTRYRGPLREDWYSICSKHQNYKADCKLCQTGQWRNRYLRHFGSFIYKNCPKLWRWWANRKNSKSRKFLEKTFPNLNNGGESDTGLPN